MKIVDYLLNSWNQVITELRQWQDLREVLKRDYSFAV